MADNPLQDNTNAQEKQSEALRDASRSVDDLKREIEENARAQRQQEAQQQPNVADLMASRKAEERSPLADVAEMARAERQRSQAEIESARRQVEESRREKQDTPPPPTMSSSTTPTPPAGQPADRGNSGVVGFGGNSNMSLAEFESFRRQVGDTLAQQLKQQGLIHVQDPLTLDELRQQSLERRFGPEQAAAINSEREAKAKHAEESRQRRQGEQEAVAEAERTRRVGEQMRKEAERKHAEESRQRRQGEQEAVAEAERTRRVGEQMRKQQTKDAELRRTQGPLPELASELAKRQSTLADYYRRGGNPDDVAARALRARVAEQEGHVGRKFAGLTPEEQEKQQPLMRDLDDQRRDVEEEELKRRKELTQQMKEGKYTFGALVRSMSRLVGVGEFVPGNRQGGVAGQLQMAENALKVGQILEIAIGKGQALLNPSMTRTANRSEVLSDMGLAASVHMTESDRAKARFYQMQAKIRFDDAKKHPRKEGDWWWDFRAKGMEEEMRKRGLLKPGEKFKPKEDIVLPGVTGGITNAMAYQQELQVGTLQREDASNEILRMQLDELKRLGVLLQNVQNNTNGLENMTPRWL